MLLEIILSIIIALEIPFGIFIVWGFAHEPIFVAFEDRMIGKFKAKIAHQVGRFIK